MFSKGWKFNMFNATQEQWNKSMAAASIVFLQVAFSLISLVMNEQHQCYSIVVFTYSLICLFSFINASYVRDFDALQVNFTPILLSFVGMFALQKTFDFMLLGMVITMIADSYFALRYKDTSDKINWTCIERFAMESWTQNAFQQNKDIALQLVCAIFIFTQLALNIHGAQQKELICFLYFVFYMTRVASFLLETVLAMKIAQSNMTAVCLAIVGGVTIFSGVNSTMTNIAIIIMILDAILGSSIFVQ